jgi:hypothetical protein
VRRQVGSELELEPPSPLHLPPVHTGSLASGSSEQPMGAIGSSANMSEIER